MRTFLVFLASASMLLASTFEEQVEQSILRSAAQYPAVMQKGTPLFQAVAAQVENLKTIAPKFFENPKWPEMLAAAEAARLGIKPSGNGASTALPFVPAHLATGNEQTAILRAQLDAQGELADQMLKMRIQQAFPDNPKMWQYLYRNPRYISYYLQDR